MSAPRYKYSPAINIKSDRSIQKQNTLLSSLNTDDIARNSCNMLQAGFIARNRPRITEMDSCCGRYQRKLVELFLGTFGSKRKLTVEENRDIGPTGKDTNEALTFWVVAVAHIG